MTAILYGNLRVEIISGIGARSAGWSHATRSRPIPPPPSRATPQAPDAWPRARVSQHVRRYRVRQTCRILPALAVTARRLSCKMSRRPRLNAVWLPEASIYERAGSGSRTCCEDLVAELFVCEQPVKLTPQECAQVLGQVSAIIAIDDLRASQGQIDYLVRVLPNCRLVIGSATPVLGERDSSYEMGGLPEDAALSLLADDLGRPLTALERAPALRLVAAIDGQPSHLRQCAALVREDGHSLRSLARQAASDPEILDRLSISSLARHQRRVLAVLALAAGTLLPITVVEAIGQGAYVAEWLQGLHRRGLAEQRDDRFGLPICKAESYRQMLFQDLHLAASARELSNWLIAADPLGADTQSAAEAAVTMIEFAGERGVLDDRGTAGAGRSARPVRRWALGSLASCAYSRADRGQGVRRQGRSSVLRPPAGHAGVLSGSAWRRISVAPASLDPAYPDRRRRWGQRDPQQSGAARAARVAAATTTITCLAPHTSHAGRVIGTLALTVSTVVLAGVIHGGGGSQLGTSPSPAVSHVKDSASGSANHVSNHGSGGPIQPSGSTAATLHLSPLSLPTETVSAADSEQITASGGTPPYSFAVTSGGLPRGLALSSGGIMSGTPTTAGSYRFTVTAIDASVPADKGSWSYALQVKTLAAPITLTPAALPALTVGVRESQQISAAGGTAPYAFSWTGSLPPGLSLSSTGLISGIPTTAGSYQFTIAATDSAATPDNGSQSYALQVNEPPLTVTLTPATLPVMVVGDKAETADLRHRRHGPLRLYLEGRSASGALAIEHRPHQRNPHDQGQLAVHDHRHRRVDSGRSWLEDLHP